MEFKAAGRGITSLYDIIAGGIKKRGGVRMPQSGGAGGGGRIPPTNLPATTGGPNLPAPRGTNLPAPTRAGELGPADVINPAPRRPRNKGFDDAIDVTTVPNAKPKRTRTKGAGGSVPPKASMLDKALTGLGIGGLGLSALGMMLGKGDDEEGDGKGTATESPDGAKAPPEQDELFWKKYQKHADSSLARNTTFITAPEGYNGTNTQFNNEYLNSRLNDPNSPTAQAIRRMNADTEAKRREPYVANAAETEAYGGPDAATNNAWKMYQRGIIGKENLPDHLRLGEIERNGMSGVVREVDGVPMYGGIPNFPQNMSPAYQQGQNELINPKQAQMNLEEGERWMRNQPLPEYANYGQQNNPSVAAPSRAAMLNAGGPRDEMSQTITDLKSNANNPQSNIAPPAPTSGFYPDGTPIPANQAYQGFSMRDAGINTLLAADDISRGVNAGRAIAAGAKGGAGVNSATRLALRGGDKLTKSASGLSKVTGATSALGKVNVALGLGSAALEGYDEIANGRRAQLYGGGARARAAGFGEAVANSLMAGGYDVIRGNFDSDYARHNQVNLDPLGTGSAIEGIYNFANDDLQTQQARNSYAASVKRQAGYTPQQRDQIAKWEQSGEFVPTSQRAQRFKQLGL